MTDIPSLAPRQKDQSSNASNPFATPTLHAADFPIVPEPAVTRSTQTPSSQPNYNDAVHHFSSEGPHHDRAAYFYKSASVSSAGDSTMTGISSIDLEKSSTTMEQHKKHYRASRERIDRHQSSRDPEKAANSPARTSRKQGSREESNEQHVAYMEDDDGDECRQMQETKAVKILLFLSGPCVVLSFLNAVWVIISLLITTMTQPVRLCARRPTFGQQLGGLLGPALNLQLKRIYTPLPPHADEDTSYNAGMLMTVQLLSPFLSLGVMIAAWVVAVFWVSSTIVGDPAGMDKRDDGRETALALRNWWESWLVKSIREE